MKNEENLSNIPLPLLPYIGLAVDSDTVEIIRMRMSKSDDKSYDNSVKLKRTEMDPFRLG